MSDDVRIAEVDQRPLAASLFSVGLTRRWFDESAGWPFGVPEHRYASGAHRVGAEVWAELGRIVAGADSSDARFWPGWAERGRSAAGRLSDVARSLAARSVDGAVEGGRLFAEFAAAARAVVPFVAAAPVVRAELVSVLTERFAARNGDPDEAGRAAARLAAPRTQPDAVRELRDFHRVAATIAADAEALGVLRSTAPAVAVGRFESDFPHLHDLIGRHLREHRPFLTGGCTREVPSPKELVERLQPVLLRWKLELVESAAEIEADPSIADVLGFVPPEPLASMAEALRDVAGLRSFRVAALVHAHCLAAPFFDALAGVLGCTPVQLSHASAEEVEAALAGASELPLDAIERRIANGWSLERTGDDVRVTAGDAPSADEQEAAPPAGITGMTASRGRAIGMVKVILAAQEVRKLGPGDVLVTGTSTPDAIGGESVFPTRAGPPLGIERASAIVTDEGGFLSHAAILAREQGIPCIVGTERASSILVDGQVVEVDATQAVGRIVPLG